MLELNNITFKSFIVSLSLLKSPLPKNKQADLNRIGREMALGLSDLGYLDKFAQDYPPLHEIYQAISNFMTVPSVERNKCNFPKEDEYSEAASREIENIVKAMEDTGEDKIDEFFLVLQHTDSVKAAKKKIKSLPIAVSLEVIQDYE